MKILIICGCLEPGKDGVGDYCRLMGASLSRLGCKVMLLSFYDQFVFHSPIIINEKENIELIDKRISASYSRKKRFLITQACITEFKPELISLQFVPYSFHAKGVDLFLPYFFGKLKKSYKWHLMVHEPWISNKMFFSMGNIIGLIQKQLLKSLVKNLRPILLHTSNPYYQEILRNGGLSTKLLHLPGNIPVNYGKTDLMKQKLMELGITEDSRNQWLVLGTFGRIRNNVLYIALLQKLLNSNEAEGKKIAFISIGNSGPLAKNILGEIDRIYKNRVLIHEFGEREPAEISGFFQCLDHGVTSVPCHLLGKSGAYAAMRNHGLKILIPEPMETRNQILKDVYNSDHLLEIKDEFFSSEKVAKTLLMELKNKLIGNVDPGRIHENPIHQS